MRSKLTTAIFGSAFVALIAGTAVAQLNPAATTTQTDRPKVKPDAQRARPVPGAFGAALADLDKAQLDAFEDGREEFESAETPEGGLGPIHNGVSCVACHSAQAAGGAGTITETRFGRLRNNSFDPLARLGGSLLQQLAIDPAALERVPTEATIVALRLTTPLFGAGLIEAIPDSEIQRNAARRQPDGITGRAAMIVDIASGQRRVGRFGWKAQHASLLGFSADAYLNEMGITSRFFPLENSPNGNTELVEKYDKLADPEDAVDPTTNRGDIDALADFMRLLAAPPPVRQTPSAAAGGRLFEQMKCAACHTPVMFTGASPIAALAHKPVPLFSELLLHDMDGLGDGIEQGAAKAREMRPRRCGGSRQSTISARRAGEDSDAIRAHDGEGAAARDRYNRLGNAEQRQLLDFLNSI